VQVIDDWTTNRRLGLVFEAKVNDGKLLVCSIDLEHGLDSDPARRQFRQSLLNYMSDKHFAPQHVVTVDQVRNLMSTASPMNRLGAIAVSTSSEELGEEGCLAIDGDPRTRWHTQWRHSGPTFPHSLQVEFESPIAIDGFTVLPRQDDRRNGWVNDYSFYVSEDGETWGEPVTHGSFAANSELKVVTLPGPASGRFFKLVAVSGFDSLPYASIAEFSIVPSHSCRKAHKLPSDVAAPSPNAVSEIPHWPPDVAAGH
jgi:hypothetical protein